MPDYAGFNYRCHTCGQGFNLARTDDFNRTEPRFCPWCGHTGNIKRAQSILSLTEAAVFVENEAKPRLIQLLYQVWRGNPDKVEDLPARFIDYLADQLG